MFGSEQSFVFVPTSASGGDSESTHRHKNNNNNIVTLRTRRPWSQRSGRMKVCEQMMTRRRHDGFSFGARRWDRGERESD